MSRAIFYQGGTLVLQDVPEHEPLSAPFQWIKGRWRCEGYHYRALQPALRQLAIQTIHRVNRSTVVVAPTIDLLHQWYAQLVHAFDTEVGVYYGGEKKVLPLTVTTYHSAGDLMAEYGNTFKLVIFDEVHHLP